MAANLPARLRAGARLALGIVLITAFLVFASQVTLSRGVLGWLTDYLPFLLYLTLAIVIAAGLLHRSALLRPVVERLRPHALAASIVAFLVPVFGTWNRGYGGANIGGVIPLADASLYFGGAQRLLFFGSLDDYNSRRPLNALFLAVRIAATDLDLRLALIIQAVLLGGACYVAARVVARDLGAIAGFAFFTALYGFIHFAISSALTETFGLTFGALAFAALWAATRDRDLWLAGVGLLLLTVALNVRSATPLLPLFLVVYFARRLRGLGSFNIKALAVCIVAVAIGYSTNYLAIAIGDGDSRNLNGNSGYLFYGMARGIPGWDAEAGSWGRVLEEHPETGDMSEVRRNRYVSRLAREEIRDHPGRFAGTVVRSGANYVVIAVDLLAGPWGETGSGRAAVIALLLGSAVLIIIRQRRAPDRLLLALALLTALVLSTPVLVQLIPMSGVAEWTGPIIAVIGIAAFAFKGVASLGRRVPLGFCLVSLAAIFVPVPLIGIDTVRIFAALAPFCALPLAFAAVILAGGGAPFTQGEHTESARGLGRWSPAFAGIGLLIVTIVGAPIAMASTDPPRVQARPCPEGSDPTALLGGVSVRVVSNGQATSFGEVELAAVAPNTVPSYAEALGHITRPLTIVSAITEQGKERIAFVESDVSAPGHSVLYLCTRPVNDEGSLTSRFHWPAPIDFAFVQGTRALLRDE